jgi:hypothetical protein
MVPTFLGIVKLLILMILSSHNASIFPYRGMTIFEWVLSSKIPGYRKLALNSPDFGLRIFLFHENTSENVIGINDFFVSLRRA